MTGVACRILSIVCAHHPVKKYYTAYFQLGDLLAPFRRNLYSPLSEETSCAPTSFPASLRRALFPGTTVATEERRNVVWIGGDVS